MVESEGVIKQVDALGHPDPDRYAAGAWPAALLARMAYWVRRVHRQGALLDLGCAEGALLDFLGERGIGLDMNSERLRLAVGKGLRVSIGDGNQLPFPNGCFDTVVCMEVLEHVADMSAVTEEVYRVLRPGGHWVVSVPNVTLRSWYEMWRERRPYYCDEREHYREFSPVSIPWFEHRFMPSYEFVRMFEMGKFEQVGFDGVRYLFPCWFSRIPYLQHLLESPKADRVWVNIPGIRKFPYWSIYVFRCQ